MAGLKTSQFDTCEKAILSASCPPLLFENAIDNWPARQWTPEILASLLGDRQFPCKVAARRTNEIPWETECQYVEATVQQFVDWLNHAVGKYNPFDSLDKERFSVYLDYKYMASLFTDQPNLLKSVTWDRFGLQGRGGESSTLWLGSTGASTPCHYDTYGFNLVAQIFGRKRWILFPPEANLYPTRIPYEESSVFSKVNILMPDLIDHPHFKNVSPVIVTLEPGQVLYVPHQWWHFVESLEPSISVNTWVEMETDDEVRFKEAITRTLFSSLVVGLEGRDGLRMENILNPHENLLSAEDNLKYVQQTLSALCQPTLGMSVSPRDFSSVDTSIHPSSTSVSTDKSQQPNTVAAETICPQQRLLSNLHKFAHAFADCQLETRSRETDFALQQNKIEIWKDIQPGNAPTFKSGQLNDNENEALCERNLLNQAENVTLSSDCCLFSHRNDSHGEKLVGCENVCHEQHKQGTVEISFAKRSLSTDPECLTKKKPKLLTQFTDKDTSLMCRMLETEIKSSTQIISKVSVCESEDRIAIHSLLPTSYSQFRELLNQDDDDDDENSILDAPYKDEKIKQPAVSISKEDFLDAILHSHVINAISAVLLQRGNKL